MRGVDKEMLEQLLRNGKVPGLTCKFTVEDIRDMILQHEATGYLKRPEGPKDFSPDHSRGGNMG
jgi:hypothetical protein